MDRRRWIRGAAVLAGAGAGVKVLAQPGESRVYLPLVAQNGATLTTLIETDCGFVSAVVVPGTTRRIVGWIDRAHGNVLKIGEDVGDHLVEVQDPILATLILGGAQAPAFTFPGPKQGAASLIIVGNILHIYATSRDEGDETGPFKLKRLSMPVPPPAG